MSEVRVRFVPRGRTSLSFSDFESAPSDVLSNQIEPTKSQMERGRRLLLDRQVATAETPKNRLEVSLTRKEFSQIFQGSQLSNRSSQSRETARLDVETLTQHESYLSTNDLKVPEALQDAIAFAYIPRPVEYHSVLSIPPRENLHYLRLSDVAMAMNAPRCHQQGLMGQKIRVAMADSGFWLHPHFIRSGARLIPTESPGSGAATEDASGHGTGEAANIFAIAPQCTVYGVKHGGSSAGTLETCIAQKPHVMTNSWGFNIDHQTRESLRQSDRQMFNELLDLEQIISSAVDDGIAVLFSAGNGHLAFPASFPDVISVGGVTVTEAGDLEASSYASGFKSKLYPGRTVPDVSGIVGKSEAKPMTGHIMLPVPPHSRLDGENFPSSRSGTGWGIFSGTSAACPQVAGVVALMKQIDPNLSAQQIRQVLEARSVDVTSGRSATGERAKPGVDLATGAGLVDALRACGFVGGIS